MLVSLFSLLSSLFSLLSSRDQPFSVPSLPVVYTLFVEFSAHRREQRGLRPPSREQTTDVKQNAKSYGCCAHFAADGILLRMLLGVVARLAAAILSFVFSVAQA